MDSLGEIVLWDERDQGGYMIDNHGEWAKIEGRQWIGSDLTKNQNKSSFTKRYLFVLVIVFNDVVFKEKYYTVIFSLSTVFDRDFNSFDNRLRNRINNVHILRSCPDLLNNNYRSNHKPTNFLLLLIVRI